MAGDPDHFMKRRYPRWHVTDRPACTAPGLHRLFVRTLSLAGRQCPAISSSNDTSSPAIALAATVAGLASQTAPGPERPGKLRLMALTVT